MNNQTFAKAAASFQSLIARCYEQPTFRGQIEAFASFRACQHVTTGECGIGPVMLMVRDKDSREYWSLVVRHPYQPGGPDEDHPTDDDMDEWPLDEEFQFHGDEQAAMRDLTMLILSEWKFLGMGCIPGFIIDLSIKAGVSWEELFDAIEANPAFVFGDPAKDPLLAKLVGAK